MLSPEDDPATWPDWWKGEASFLAPLRRVSFAEGMLLGVEALRAEQAYHRVRLSRHHYWLHGDGTIAGLAVRLVYDASPLAADRSRSIRVRLVVSPGVALDAFGREVVVPEEQELVLNDWLPTQEVGGLERARDAAGLALRVTLRQRPVPVGFQPVLARRINSVTDAVDASRLQDSFGLELLPDESRADPLRRSPLAWQRALPTLAQIESKLSDQERARLAELRAQDPGVAANAAALAAFTRRARLLHAFDAGAALPDVVDPDQDELVEQSRVQLARVTLEAAPAEPLLTLPISPARLRIDNDARRFAAPVEAAFAAALDS